MSRTVAIVLGGAAATLAFVVLRGVSAESPLPPPHDTVGRVDRSSSPSPPPAAAWSSSAIAAPTPAPELGAPAPAADAGALGRDPEGARRVLGLIGRPGGTREQKVASIRAAISASGACAEPVCAATRAALLARVDAASTQSGGQLSVRASECFQVACVVEVATPGAAIEPLLERLQNDGQLEWPVPTLFTRPLLAEDGAQSALWVFFNPA